MVWNDTEKDVNILITRARVSAKIFIGDSNGKFPKQHNSSNQIRQMVRHKVGRVPAAFISLADTG